MNKPSAEPQPIETAIDPVVPHPEMPDAETDEDEILIALFACEFEKSKGRPLL